MKSWLSSENCYFFLIPEISGYNLKIIDSILDMPGVNILDSKTLIKNPIVTLNRLIDTMHMCIIDLEVSGGVVD